MKITQVSNPHGLLGLNYVRVIANIEESGRKRGCMEHLDQTYYVFDLDNTLYRSDSGFFDQQMALMNEFIQQTLQVDHDEAAFIRDDYYHRFGTTLHGLMYYHDVDPQAYFDHVNQVSLDHLSMDPALLFTLNRLREEGKQTYVWTNASRGHTKRVMKHLGFNRLFDGVVTLECTGFLPKPSPKFYDHALAANGIDPMKAVFFEDSSHNLAAAKEYGMQTVLIQADDTAHARFVVHPEIDFLVKDIVSFFQGNYIDSRAASLNRFM